MKKLIPFTLCDAIRIRGRLIEVWSRPHAGKYWNVRDYEIRVDGRTVEVINRDSIFANALKAWERLSGLAWAGYDNGKSHYRHRRTGQLYRAQWNGFDNGTTYEPVTKAELSQ